LKNTNRVASLLPMIGLLAVGVCMPAEGSVIVSINPSTQNVVTGNTTSVTVNISGVTDLFSYQFDFFFTPLIVSATSITEGPFLASSGNSTDFFPGSIDNTAGNILSSFGTSFGAGPGVDGSGILAFINFTAGNVGTATLSLDNIILDDSQGNTINFNQPVTSNIVVTSAGGVPEPATAALVASSISLALWGRRRRG
jgi:hypothetical protein